MEVVDNEGSSMSIVIGAGFEILERPRMLKNSVWLGGRRKFYATKRNFVGFRDQRPSLEIIVGIIRRTQLESGIVIEEAKERSG